ncbi:MAG: phospholipase [Methylotenera sp.]|nr:phospholipase [Methylotenera sp.]
MNQTKLYCIALAVSLLSMNGWAADTWLIASQSESINLGQTISIDIAKAEPLSNWPKTFTMKLFGNGVSEAVLLSPTKYFSSSTLRRTYIGVASKKYVGVVRAELMGESSNRLILLALNEYAGSTQIDETPNPTNLDDHSHNLLATKSTATVVVIASPSDEPTLSANEPMYFVVGKDAKHGSDSRFQLSFKYRPFDPAGSVSNFAPFFSNLYFAYTQTTLWDFGDNSSPFRDTSYRPSVFYRWAGSGRGLLPDTWRAGAEHESNGQAGTNSRSLNTFYVRPSWNFDLANGRQLIFSPKFQQYLNKNDNADIARYRGYIDWQLRYGREDGLILSNLYRLGTGGYSTNQLDISYPLSDRIFARTGAFIHLQLLSGYGETLLDYNKSSDTQIRLGLSIAR